MKIVLAGAYNITNINKLIKIFKKNNIDLTLIESHNMHSRIAEEYKKQVIETEELPDYEGCIIPLNEYWVTKLLEAQNNGRQVGPSRNALLASRSKMFLSAMLKDANLKFVPRFLVRDIKKLNCNKLIIRPDGGYSGYGVTIIDNNDNLNAFQIMSQIEKTSPTKMLNILGQKETIAICEPFINGIEFSTDIFKYKETIQIIRLSRKYIKWINDSPCAIGYIQENVNPDIQAVIKDWVNVIFDQQDISFGQFDFIKTEEGDYIPLDFSCRIGGGLDNLKTFSCDEDPYANSIVNMLRGKPLESFFKPNWCQYNILSDLVGVISNIKIDWPREYQIFFKKNKGDYIGNYQISSTNGRIAEVIDYVADEKTFNETCKCIDEYIKIETVNK